MTTTNRWHLQGSAGHAYSGAEARQLLRNRWDWGNQETWFENEAGRLLAVVTNGERSMVVLLDGEGDPGEHLVDPRGEGSSGGYLLSNGQDDTYADRDTVAFDVAGHAVAYFIEHGTWPAEVTAVKTAAEDEACPGTAHPGARDGERHSLKG
ncbi:hypothetical protein J7E99_04915 [Streptomyces sp. ISL-44]|uniref:Imm1 family immunity protein n=1 Tax=Streptomyces sp. ISL-44 TaxID=2819184 RepID=UPI001BEB2F6B|nr:Imm1 family immunity protein [Streptomyces sp. ISL-44]MBT2540063.1 hypothetical protein [Streptomyces sp. ISL-44]